MQSYAFAIDERPLRVWDWKLRDEDLEFLRGVDPEYFVHVAEVNAAALRDGRDQRAALAIRLAHSHALETLMAFAAATFQAPACTFAWLLRYSNEDLRSVIRKVTRGHLELAQLAGPPTWDGLAATVVAGVTASDEQNAVLSSTFGRLWRRMAVDFLDESQEVEYNSLKHGMRVTAGGFAIAIAAPRADGQAPLNEDFVSLSESEYGSSYFVVEKPVGGKIDFRPRNCSRNWHPENLFHGLQLIATSLGNLVGYLRAQAGDDPSQCRFEWPDDASRFDSPWQHSTGVSTLSLDTDVAADNIQPSTKEDVLEAVRKAQATGRNE